MSYGWLAAVGTLYSVKTPLVVTFAILFAPISTNHRLPSEPVTIPTGWDPDVGTLYSVKAPLVVTFPTLFALTSVNQRLPSGPSVIASELLAAVGI